MDGVGVGDIVCVKCRPDFAIRVVGVFAVTIMRQNKSGDFGVPLSNQDFFRKTAEASITGKSTNTSLLGEAMLSYFFRVISSMNASLLADMTGVLRRVSTLSSTTELKP